jgi:hypothetical protein
MQVGLRFIFILKKVNYVGVSKNSLVIWTGNQKYIGLLLASGYLFGAIWELTGGGRKTRGKKRGWVERPPGGREGSTGRRGLGKQGNFVEQYFK